MSEVRTEENKFSINPVWEAKKDERREGEAAKFLRKEDEGANRSGWEGIKGFAMEMEREFPGITVVVQDKETGNRYSFNPKEEKEPGVSEEMRNWGEKTILIRDSAVFLDKLKRYQGEINKRRVEEKGKNRWFEYQTFLNVWLNATPGDLLSPESYLERQVFQTNDRTFDALTEWHEAGAIPVVGEKLFVEHHTPVSDFESPHELRFAFSSAEEPEKRDVLPVVRYGRVDLETMVVYAVQMPALGNEKTEAQINGILEKARQLAEESRKYFLDQYRTNKRAYLKTLGEIPPEILAIEDPEQFSVQYYDYLQKKAEKEGYRDVVLWAYDHRYQPDSLREKIWSRISGKEIENALSWVRYPVERLQETALVLKKKDEMEDLLEAYKERSVRLRRLNDSLRTGVPAELRNAPPPAVVSLAIALKMFEQAGVRKVKLPLFLPFRQHGDDEIDHRILEQNMAVFRRAAHEISGFEITEDSGADGYLYAEIKGGLTSERPIFKEVFQNLPKIK